jgi:hypothetical protein
MTEPAPPIGGLRRDLPSQFSSAIDRCLAKNPDDRFANADELARVLGVARSTATELAPPLARIVDAAMQFGVEVAGSIALIGVAALVNRPGTDYTGFFRAVNVDLLLGAFVAVMALVIAATRAIDSFGLIRDALSAGYSAAQIRAAFQRSSTLTGSRRSTPLTMAMVAGTIALLFYWMVGREVLPFAILTDAPVLLATALMARSTARRALANESWLGRTWRRWWHGPVGMLACKLASIGIEHRDGPGAAEPTELVLGNAVDIIFRDLSSQHRRTLQELPSLVTRLERHGEALRKRRDELESAAAEAGGGRRRDFGAGTEMEIRLRESAATAQAALEAARQGVVAQLSMVLAALETIRLDLIRLRAGAATTDDLTSDLEAARVIGDGVEALLAGEAEVARITAPR